MGENPDNFIVFKEGPKDVPVVSADRKITGEVKKISDILKNWKENKNSEEKIQKEIIPDLKSIIESKYSAELDELKAFDILMQLTGYDGEHNRGVVEYVVKNILGDSNKDIHDLKLGIFGSRFQKPSLIWEIADELDRKKGEAYKKRFLKQFANTAEAIKEIADSDPEKTQKEIIDFAKMCVDNFSENRVESGSREEEEILNMMREMSEKYRGDPNRLNDLLDKKTSSSKNIENSVEEKKIGGFVSEEAVNTQFINAFFDKIKNFMVRERISPKEFEAEYGKKTIEKDIRDSEDLNRRQKEKDKRGSTENSSKLAAVSEFLLCNLIKEEKIFGEDFTAHLPTLYDDQKNKTDVIIEYKRKNVNTGEDISNNAFLVDVVIDEEGQGEKRKGLLREVAVKELGKIKYFTPKGFKKEIKGKEIQFPRLILRLNIEQIENLMEIFDKREKTNEDVLLLNKISGDILRQFVDSAKGMEAESKDIPEIKREYFGLSSALAKISNKA